MKSNFLTFIMIVCIISGNSLHSQVLVLRKDSAYKYRDSKFSGKYYKGNKIGHWTETSNNGIIYSESDYDSLSKPVGIWKINFPDGNPRSVTEYSDNNAVKFSIFRYKHKVAEITSDIRIPDSLYRSLDNFENKMYQREKYTVEKWSVGYKGTAYRGMDSYHTDPFVAVNRISGILKDNKFTGIMIVWNKDYTISNKREYIQGNETKYQYFYNKKGLVTKQEQYRNYTLTKTISFKPNGEQKVKVIRN